MGMQEDALQRGFPAPDEACAGHGCLEQGVETSDPVTTKDFFQSYILTLSISISSV
jgi:hypothetical protein